MFHKLVLLDYIPAGKIHVTHIPTLPAEAWSYVGFSVKSTDKLWLLKPELPVFLK
jgi:hypothetical protein